MMFSVEMERAKFVLDALREYANCLRVGGYKFFLLFVFVFC